MRVGECDLDGLLFGEGGRFGWWAKIPLERHYSSIIHVGQPSVAGSPQIGCTHSDREPATEGWPTLFASRGKCMLKLIWRREAVGEGAAALLVGEIDDEAGEGFDVGGGVEASGVDGAEPEVGYQG